MDTPPPPGVSQPPKPDPPEGFTPTGFYPSAYTPAGQAGPPPPPPSASKRNGIAGGIGAALLGVAKFGGAALAFLAKGGLLFLKVFKFGGTIISMLISLVIFVGIFGPLYGAGFLALIVIHESGHVVMAWLEGVPVSAPLFLGPFGAVVRFKRDVTPHEEAISAVGGPAFGLIGAFACFVYGMSGTMDHTHALFLALAYMGCFMNLFNLIPFSPLDGGRVAGAVSPKANFVGLIMLGGFFILSGGRGLLNPFLLLLIIAGIYTTIQRFKQMRAGTLPPPLPLRTRVMIGVMYIGLVGVAAMGMSAAHAQLVDAGYAPRPDSYTPAN